MSIRFLSLVHRYVLFEEWGGKKGREEKEFLRYNIFLVTYIVE